MPSNPIQKKNIDPKTSAQNDLSLRYQSNRPKTQQLNWVTYPTISPIILPKTEPASRDGIKTLPATLIPLVTQVNIKYGTKKINKDVTFICPGK